MPSIEETRAKARRSLHETMGRPAFYYPSRSDPLVSVATKVRPHSKRGMIGDLPGTNLNYAEVIDRVERVVFWRADVPAPARNGLVVMMLGGFKTGFILDAIDPPDGQTISASVVMASASEIEDFPYPGEV